jgi:hypothetical protein
LKEIEEKYELCKFYKPKGSHLGNKVVNKDIEDLFKIGKEEGFCPFYEVKYN